jgi:hypothetical protein
MGRVSGNFTKPAPPAQYSTEDIELLANTETTSQHDTFYFRKYAEDLQYLAKNSALSVDLDMLGADLYCEWARRNGLPLYWIGGQDYAVARSFRHLSHHIQRRKARGWQ